MQYHLPSVAVLTLLASLAQAADQAPPLSSGIVVANMDSSVRLQDDFFQHQNGKWLKTVVLPPEKSYLDPFAERADEASEQLRGIVERAAAGGPGQDADARRIGDFYASFMDEARIEELGARPLKAELDRIAAIHDRSQLAALLAHLAQIGVDVPIMYGVTQDYKDATRMAAALVQAGLGLPEADYYVKTDDARLASIKAAYQAYIQTSLALLGNPHAAADAKAVVDFETALARVQLTPTELRDPAKAYNKFAFAELPKLAPGFDWQSWLDTSTLPNRTTSLVVMQATYVKAFADIANRAPLATWKAYLSTSLLRGYGRYLSKPFVDANSAFFDKELNGIETQAPRWKRAIDAVEESQGEALGKLYVAQYFPAERKARMEVLVKNLIAAYRQRVDTLDWMGPATRQEARAKLDKLRYKIGYPYKWKDYSALVVKRDDLVGNVIRSRIVEDNRDLDKLGKPIDPSTWIMTPQTANAYYSPQTNEMVFPAVMLQPPFFDATADDAVNYGAIGTVIAHELSHGFDDQGSQFDADGNLRDWWSAEDKASFKAKARRLTAQYEVFEPMKGYHVNGALTLGENIADNAGLSIAYQAYHISLQGKPAPLIDGFSGDQRLYMGYAQIWRQKLSDNFMVKILKSNAHAPGEVRTNGALRNQPGFYQAFGIKPGDKMYLAPEDRVLTW